MDDNKNEKQPKKTESIDTEKRNAIKQAAYLAPMTIAMLTADKAFAQQNSGTISDRLAKENFEDVDNHAILSKLASLNVEKWNYIGEDQAIRHIGPMAQEFAATFNVGRVNTRIDPVDAIGVSLASIKALYEMIQQKDRRIATLEQEVKQLKGMD